MYKKTLLSVAIASAISLTGCLDRADNENEKHQENAGVKTNPPALTQTEIEQIVQSQGTYPVFNPALAELPIPIDLIFDREAGDGSFSVGDSAPPVTTALNSLSGASTVAPIDIAISGDIDGSSLNGTPLISLSPLTPNPNQNVFLLELAYASGSPVQGLSAQEPPTVAGFADVEVSEITLDGTSYIRLNPKSPLKPNTRYIAVITNEVAVDAENFLQASPSYQAIKDVTKPLASGSLASVRALINGLWEKVAVGYFDKATNLVRAQMSMDTLTADNIALSYSFTTSGDEKVLNYIADPSQWFADQITTFVGVNTAKAVVGGKLDVASTDGTGAVVAGADGNVDYADVKLSVDGAIAAFPVNAANPSDTTISDALAPIASAFALIPGCSGVTSGSNYINCVGAVLANAPSSSGGFADLLPTPAATTITFDDTSTIDIYQSSSLPASLMKAASVPAGTVSVTQGTLTLPYYLGQPAGTNGTPLVTDSWQANDVLASAINTAFAPLGLSLPQADPSVSTVVNYVFPFPKSTGDVEIPILAVHPTNHSGDMSTVMWQHGITTDRSTALTFGGSMVAGAKGQGRDIAVIAIDQPLHGIDGISDTDRAALAERLLVSNGTISNDMSADGSSDDPADQATISAVVAGLFSAGLVQQIDTPCPFVSIADNGLEATTTSLLGGACDGIGLAAELGSEPSEALASAQLLEKTIRFGASQIPGLGAGSDSERHFGFTANPTTGGAPLEMDYDGLSAANGSGSMFINFTNFLTSRDNLRQQVLDLLAVRKSVGSIDLNPTADDGADLNASDVYFIGHSLGTINGIPFVAVANDSSTTTDNIVAANFLTPGGGISRFFENSPVFAPRVVDGLAAIGFTQDTSNFQAYVNTLQASLDSIDPINFVDDFAGKTPVLFTEAVGDNFIPNAVDTADKVLGDGSISFLAGTEPLATFSEASTISASGALTQNIVRFTNAVHETPVFPLTGTLAEQAAYAEMVSQATSMVLTGGTAIQVTTTPGIVE